MTKPTIAITPGEPSGIGADICLSLTKQFPNANLVFICDPELLYSRANLLNLNINFNIINETHLLKANCFKKNYLSILPVKLRDSVLAGTLNPRNSHYVLETLDVAIKLCLNNDIDALVTGPIHKGIINQAGIMFTGHTEYLEEKSASKAVMMLQTDKLRVALVTTHVPLKEVSAIITQGKLKCVCLTLLASLKSNFNIAKPRISLCGLNPHAGESGYLGHEEIETIQPVVQELASRGHLIQGPFPADTLFINSKLDQYDAVLAMYHDQGLPVLKSLGFGKAVNISLGLPFIRTSVDHGTALEIAGTGKANASSLIYAVETALHMSKSKRENFLIQNCTTEIPGDE